MIDEQMPYTSTGPASVNSFAPTPMTRPSRRNSIAGETTELAKPVIGTMLPAPAYLPILSYTPMPVSSAERKTRQMLVPVAHA